MHKQRENCQLFLKPLSTLLQYQTHFHIWQAVRDVHSWLFRFQSLHYFSHKFLATLDYTYIKSRCTNQDLIKCMGIHLSYCKESCIHITTFNSLLHLLIKDLLSRRIFHTNSHAINFVNFIYIEIWLYIEMPERLKVLSKSILGCI